jgi:hypothetical protein
MGIGKLTLSERRRICKAEGRCTNLGCSNKATQRADGAFFTLCDSCRADRKLKREAKKSRGICVMDGCSEPAAPYTLCERHRAAKNLAVRNYQTSQYEQCKFLNICVRSGCGNPTAKKSDGSYYARCGGCLKQYAEYGTRYYHNLPQVMLDALHTKNKAQYWGSKREGRCTYASCDEPAMINSDGETLSKCVIHHQKHQEAMAKHRNATKQGQSLTNYEKYKAQKKEHYDQSKNEGRCTIGGCSEMAYVKNGKVTVLCMRHRELFAAARAARDAERAKRQAKQAVAA